VVRLSALGTGGLYPQAKLLVLISVRDWVDPRATVRSEGLCQWKIPVIPSGIELATVRFVAQHLNHCTTGSPSRWLRGNSFGLYYPPLPSSFSLFLWFRSQEISSSSTKKNRCILSFQVSCRKSYKDLQACLHNSSIIKYTENDTETRQVKSYLKERDFH